MYFKENLIQGFWLLKANGGNDQRGYFYGSAIRNCKNHKETMINDASCFWLQSRWLFRKIP